MHSIECPASSYIIFCKHVTTKNISKCVWQYCRPLWLRYEYLYNYMFLYSIFYYSVGRQTNTVLLGLARSLQRSAIVTPLYFAHNSSVVDWLSAIIYDLLTGGVSPHSACTGKRSLIQPHSSYETVPLGPICLSAVISSVPGVDDGDPLGHSSTGICRQKTNVIHYSLQQ